MLRFSTSELNNLINKLYKVEEVDKFNKLIKVNKVIVKARVCSAFILG